MLLNLIQNASFTCERTLCGLRGRTITICRTKPRSHTAVVYGHNQDCTHGQLYTGIPEQHCGKRLPYRSHSVSSHCDRTGVAVLLRCLLANCKRDMRNRVRSAVPPECNSGGSCRVGSVLRRGPACSWND